MKIIRSHLAHVFYLRFVLLASFLCIVSLRDALYYSEIHDIIYRRLIHTLPGQTLIYAEIRYIIFHVAHFNGNLIVRYYGAHYMTIM